MCQSTVMSITTTKKKKKEFDGRQNLSFLVCFSLFSVVYACFLECR